MLDTRHTRGFVRTTCIPGFFEFGEQEYCEVVEHANEADVRHDEHLLQSSSR